MANESTLTTYNDVYPASAVADKLLDEERPYNAMTKEMFWFEPFGGSNIMDFPIQADPGVAAASTEGTGIANATSGFSSDEASATLGTVGQMTTVTDELRDTPKFDMIPHVGRVLGRSTAEKRQTDYTDLLDGGGNTTGTPGIATSAATLQEATNQLAQRDQVGTMVGVIDPAQVGNVQLDFGTTGATFAANPGVKIGSLLATDLQAYVGEWAGASWFQSSLVTTTGGGVFIAGVALGLYEQWALRIAYERDESMPGTEVVAFERYGVTEVRDRALETILI